MKALLLLIIGVCLCATPLSAQDIESKLSGSTATHGFTIKDGAGTSLFRLGGDGRIGMGTTSPMSMIHMNAISGNVNGLRVSGATSWGWSGIYVFQTGLGNSARFDIDNTSSVSNCLSANTNGSAATISANSTNANGKILELMNGTTQRFLVESDGTVSMDGRLGMGTSAPGGKLHITGNGTNGIRITPWESTSSAVYVSQNGSGNAGRFDITLNTSTNNCLEATTNAAAPAIWANSTNAGGRILQANNGSSTVRFFIESGGNVGIGVDDATQDLDVLNNARFRGVTSIAYSAPLNLSSTGVLTTATSDRRLKTNIQSLGGSLEKVLKLRGVRYNWKAEPDGGKRIGFIAQEVEAVVPEVVYTNPVDGYKGLNYAELTALLTEAVKEQQVMIDALKTRTDEVAALQQRVRQMEARDARVHQLEADLVSLRQQLEEFTAGRSAAQASLRSEK